MECGILLVFLCYTLHSQYFIHKPQEKCIIDCNFLLEILYFGFNEDMNFYKKSRFFLYKIFRYEIRFSIMDKISDFMVIQKNILCIHYRQISYVRAR